MHRKILSFESAVHARMANVVSPPETVKHRNRESFGMSGAMQVKSSKMLLFLAFALKV